MLGLLLGVVVDPENPAIIANPLKTMAPELRTANNKLPPHLHYNLILPAIKNIVPCFPLDLSCDLFIYLGILIKNGWSIYRRRNLSDSSYSHTYFSLRHQADTHNRSPSPRSPTLHHPRSLDVEWNPVMS